MGNFLDIIGQWVIDHYAFRHVIIAFGVLIQGEVTAIIGMYLILNNYLGWGGFFLAVGIGLFVYEGFFYFLGRYLKDSPLGLRIQKKIPHYAKARFYLLNHADKFLIISKFLVYVNVAVIFLSGLIKLNFKRFLINRLIANTIWVITVTAGAFFFVGGLSLLRLRQMEIAVVVIIVLIFIAKHLLKKLFRKGFVIEEKAQKIGEAINKDFPSQQKD